VILLGFDTATPSTAVALLRRDAGTTLEARDDPPAGERPRHTSELLPLATRLMSEAEVGWEQLEGIAVGLGPGTFTGLRVGIATARALAQSLHIPLIGVPSLRALAEPALSEAQPSAAGVLSVLDARRGEAFVAAYARRDGATIELLAPRAVRPQQLAEVAAEMGAAGGSESTPLAGGEESMPLAVGDGAIRFRGELEAAGAALPGEHSPLHVLSAAAICELAALQCQAQSVEQVLPLYGRRPDAEIAIEAGSR
jgi:tRNA threonylcarbamoyladenosine biosynthesis protein TsaB